MPCTQPRDELIFCLETVHWTIAQPKWNSWRIPSWFKKSVGTFGSVNDRILGCEFLAGLSDNISELGIDQLLARTWSILKDMELITAAVRMTNIEWRAAGNSNVLKLWKKPKCYWCGGPNHFSRDCQSLSNTGGMNNQLHCYLCKELDHILWNYLGNESTDKVSSPSLLPLCHWMWHYLNLVYEWMVCYVQWSSTLDVHYQ